MRKCPNCYKYIKLEEWPMYKGRYSSYCRECKRQMQRDWIRNKREQEKLLMIKKLREDLLSK